MSDPVIPKIVERHMVDASFLWVLRAQAVMMPHFNLPDLARLEERLEAHLDGLRIAGAAGWEIAQKELEAIGEAGEAFVAAALALEEGAESRAEKVIETVAEKPKGVPGLTSALGWLPYERVAAVIKRLLQDGSPEFRRAGLTAIALHRKNPGSALVEAFGSEDGRLRARALRLAGELGMVDLHVTVRANLKAQDPACRFWAAWSSALLKKHADAVAYLQRLAESGDPRGPRAAVLAVRLLPLRDVKSWLVKLAREKGQVRTAIQGAGALGEVEAVAWLIEQMKVPALARCAGEALSLITGVNIERDGLEGPRPEGFESGPTESPDDDEVALDPDDRLGWPDPGRVQAWWQAQRGRFEKNVRYLLGRPVDRASALEALRTGYQRQRAAAALELGILEPGRPLFDVRAPAQRQQRLLS
jgi:uncharacterized protein (TIGR02270 family)